MKDKKQGDDLSRALMLLPGELVGDCRTRLIAERDHTAARRKQALAEQSSQQHTPDKRIRLWERLHALALPLDQGHPLLEVVAKATGLTLEQLHNEQRSRAAAAVASGTQGKRELFDPYHVLTASAIGLPKA